MNNQDARIFQVSVNTQDLKRAIRNVVTDVLVGMVISQRGDTPENYWSFVGVDMEEIAEFLSHEPEVVLAIQGCIRDYGVNYGDWNYLDHVIDRRLKPLYDHFSFMDDILEEAEDETDVHPDSLRETRAYQELMSEMERQTDHGYRGSYDGVRHLVTLTVKYCALIVENDHLTAKEPTPRALLYKHFGIE